MWAIPTGTRSVLKKNQVKSPSPESRVPELGSYPPIGLDRDSGIDKYYIGHIGDINLKRKRNAYLPQVSFSIHLFNSSRIHTRVFLTIDES